jgi:hypothetical protein
MKQKLSEILNMPGAGESELLKAVAALVTERQQAKDNAAFEARIASLQSITHMTRECAVETLRAQDGPVNKQSK